MPLPDTYVSAAPIEIEVGAAQGIPGKSAYQSYVDTTADDPVLTEEQWLAAMEGTTDYNDLDNKPVAGVDFAPAYPRAIAVSVNDPFGTTHVGEVVVPFFRLDANGYPEYYLLNSEWDLGVLRAQLPQLGDPVYGWNILGTHNGPFSTPINKWCLEDVASPDLGTWPAGNSVASADITTPQSVTAALGGTPSMEGHTHPALTSVGDPNAGRMEILSDDSDIDGRIVTYAGTVSGEHFWSESGNLPDAGASYTSGELNLHCYGTDIEVSIFGLLVAWNTSAPHAETEPWLDTPIPPYGPAIFDVILSSPLPLEATHLGQLCYDTTTNPPTLYFWNGTAWALGGDELPLGVSFPSGTGTLALTGSAAGVPDALTNGTISGTVTFGTGAAANFRTAAKVPASDPTGITDADAITNIVSLTAAEYAAITPNATTVYIVI